jgi:hypothetical protein
MILNAQLLSSILPGAYTADRGIEQSQTRRRGGGLKSDGKIIEIGDLALSAAHAKLDTRGCLVLPGRIVHLEDWSPRSNLSGERVDRLIASSITAVIGCADSANEGEIDLITAAREMPINWGLAGRIDKADSLSDMDRVDRIARAAALGVVAFATDRANEAIWHQFDHSDLPLAERNQRPSSSFARGSYRDISQHAARLCSLLNLHGNCGRLGRDAYAHLAMSARPERVDANASVNSSRLACVMVAGGTVWGNAKQVCGAPGVFLRRG